MPWQSVHWTNLALDRDNWWRLVITVKGSKVYKILVFSTDDLWEVIDTRKSLISFRREQSLSCWSCSLPLRNRVVHYPIHKIIIPALNYSKRNRVQILTPCVSRSKATLLCHLYPDLLSSLFSPPSACYFLCWSHCPQFASLTTPCNGQLLVPMS